MRCLFIIGLWCMLGMVCRSEEPTHTVIPVVAPSSPEKVKLTDVVKFETISPGEPSSGSRADVKKLRKKILDYIQTKAKQPIIASLAPQVFVQLNKDIAPWGDFYDEGKAAQTQSLKYAVIGRQLLAVDAYLNFGSPQNKSIAIGNLSGILSFVKNELKDLELATAIAETYILPNLAFLTAPVTSAISLESVLSSTVFFYYDSHNLGRVINIYQRLIPIARSKNSRDFYIMSEAKAYSESLGGLPKAISTINLIGSKSDFAEVKENLLKQWKALEKAGN